MVRLPETAKQELQWRFEDFKKMRFPKVPAGEEEAADLRVRLVLYDAYIAGYLTRLFDGGNADQGRLYFNEALKGQLEQFGRRRPDLTAFVEGCLDYLSVVHSLIRVSKDRAAQ
jgi:hypothetical protein